MTKHKLLHCVLINSTKGIVNLYKPQHIRSSPLSHSPTSINKYQFSTTTNKKSSPLN